MGLLYERAAVEFWAGVATDAISTNGSAVKARVEDDGAAPH